MAGIGHTRKKRTMYFIMLSTLLIVLLSMGLLLKRSDSIDNEYLPKLSAANKISHYIMHIYAEQQNMSSSEYEAFLDMQAEYLKKVHQYIAALLQGAKDPETGADIYFIKDNQRRETAKKMLALIDEIMIFDRKYEPSAEEKLKFKNSRMPKIAILAEELKDGMLERIQELETDQVAVGYTVLLLSMVFSVLLMVVFNRFINNEEKSAKKLQEQTEYLTITLNSIAEGVINCTPDGKIIDINPMAASMAGYEIKEMIGLHIGEALDISHVVTRGQLKNPVETVAASEAIQHYPALRLISKSGEEYYISMTASPIEKSDKSFLGVVIVFINITDKYLSDQTIKLSEERLNFALYASNEGLWDYNAQTNVIYCSPRWFEMLGYEYDPRKSTMETFENMLHPDERNTVMKNFVTYISSGNLNYHNEFRMQNSRREYQWILSQGKCVEWDEKGKPLRIVGTHSDITERKQLEQEVVRTNSELTILNTFVSGMNTINNDKQLLEYVLDNTLKLLNLDSGGVYFADLELNRAHLVHSKNLPMMFTEEVQEINITKAPYYSVFLNSIALYTDNFAENTKLHEISGINTLASIPIVSAKGVIGAINLASYRKHRFTEFEKTIMELIGKETGAGLLRIRSGRDIRQREFLYSAVTENSSDIIMLADSKHEIKYVSSSTANILGYKPEEQIQQPAESFVHPDDKSTFSDAMKIVAKKNEGFKLTIDYKLKKKSGDYIYTQTVLTNMLETEGVNGIALNSRDITDRRLTEEALQKSEKEYRFLFDRMPVAYVLHEMMYDETGKPVNCRYLKTNPAFGNLTGLKDAEGKTIKDFFPDVQDLIDTYYRIFETGKQLQFEYYLEPTDDWWEILGFHFEGNMFALMFSKITDRKRVERALQQSEERLKLVLKGADLAYWDWDIQSDTVIYNERFMEMLGYSGKSNEISFGQWKELIHPDDIDDYLKYLNENFQQKDEILNTEYRIRTDNNGWIWVLNRGKVVARSGESEPVRMVGTLLDITDRRLAEEAVQNSEVKFRTLVTQSPFAIKIFTRHGYLQQMNPAAEELWGISAAELIGSYNCLEDSQLADNGVLEYVERAFAGESTAIPDYYFEAEKTFGKGNARWIHAKIYPLKNEQGGIENVVKVYEDITSRKLAEQELFKTQALFRAAIDQTPVGIIMADAPRVEMRIVNSAAVDILGYDTEEDVDILLQKVKHMAEDSEMYDDSGKRLKSIDLPLARAIIRKQDTSNKEILLKGKKGEKWLLANSAPVYDKDGKMIAGITVFSDISEQKRSQKEREQLIDDLERKNAEMERFTYTVSHDLRSPLITIKGFLGMLVHDAEHGNIERMKSDMTRISKATDKMQGLLEDLLNLSRIGRIINPSENINMTELVKEVAEMLHGSINESKATVRIQENMPIIQGDRQRMHEVFQNLMENSLKFMGELTEAEISIGCEELEKEYKFYVTDNGIGIDNQYLDKVFGLFDKLDQHTEGSGIGLALIKRIIETHGGNIWIVSEGLGKGAQVYFTVPKHKM